MKKILTATAIALCIIGCTETKVYYVTVEAEEETNSSEEDKNSSSGQSDPVTAVDEPEEEDTDTNPHVGSYIFSNDTIAVTITVTKLVQPYRSFLSVFNDICPMESGFPYWQSYREQELSGEWPDFACVYSNNINVAVMTNSAGSIGLTAHFDGPDSLIVTVTENTTENFSKHVYLPEVMELEYDPDLEIKSWDH